MGLLSGSARNRSRSPRGTAPFARGAADCCRFCGETGPLEFGREECFCSAECYRQSARGCEAVDWDAAEVLAWVDHCGFGRWLRQLRFLDSGRTLLTQLNEDRLQRLGVPRQKARGLIADIERLRQGVWAQPEPPLSELPLDVVAKVGQKLHPGWRCVLSDAQHRSFAALCKNAIDDATAWRWFETLRSQLPWQDLTDERYQSEGKTIPRRTIFTVMPGCACVYKYSGVKVPPFVEPDFVADIRKACVAMTGLQEQPNSCNINLYRNGHDSVGWHTDNEPLFEGEYNDACILSLSLGATRKFQVKRIVPKGSNERSPATTIVVAHGDLCTMEGRFQRYYLHAVPKEPGVNEPRINLTWRWTTKHNQVDGCKLHGPGN